MTDIERVKQLTEILNQYRDEYYNLSRPSVSDEEYDALVQRQPQALPCLHLVARLIYPGVYGVGNARHGMPGKQGTLLGLALQPFAASDKRHMMVAQHLLLAVPYFPRRIT